MMMMMVVMICSLNYVQAIRALKLKAGEDVEDTALLGRLMAYCSKVRFFYCSKVRALLFKG